MPQFFRSSAGFVALIILGLVIGAAGTATAAKLITGKDIKNGTITAKDIKPGTIGEKQLSGSVKSKLNATGTQGSQGPKGDAGATGQQGPKGDPGADAPGGFIVKDGNGNRVDGFISAGTDGGLREVDGGLWSYSWDGTVPAGGAYFASYDCTGEPLFNLDSAGPPNPQWRFRGPNGKYYRYPNAPGAYQVAHSDINSSGPCQTRDTGDYYSSGIEVSAPPTIIGPLTILAKP